MLKLQSIHLCFRLFGSSLAAPLSLNNMNYAALSFQIPLRIFFWSYKCSLFIIAILQNDQRFSVYFSNAQLHLKHMLSKYWIIWNAISTCQQTALHSVVFFSLKVYFSLILVMVRPSLSDEWTEENNTLTFHGHPLSFFPWFGLSLRS